MRLRDAQQRTLFEEALNPILVVDESGRYVDANQAALDFLECEREELLGKAVWDFARPDLLRQPQEEHTPFVGRRTFEAEYLVRGKIKTLLLSVVPVDLGERTVLYGLGQDITERKVAEEALRRRTQQTQALREIGLELASELDIDALLASIVSRAADLLDCTVGGLYLVRPEGDALELVVGQGLDPAQIGLLIHSGEGLAGKIWQTGEPLIVEDYHHWAGRVLAYDRYAFDSVVGVPVCWGDCFLGVLDITSESPRSFTEADVELLSLFAAQAAIAITNARLFHAEQQRRREAEALRQASLALSSTLDTGQVLEQVVEQIGTVLAYDAAYVWWLTGESVRIIHWSGEVDAEIAEAIQAKELSLSRAPALARLARTRRPHVIPDTRADPHWQRLDKMEWILSWAGAPIIVAHEEVVGFLSVASTMPGRYRPDDAEVLAAFAAHTAVAIGNARLYSLTQQAYDELKDAQSRLVQSARLAAIGELAAGVAHELNNPLTSVLGFSELALHGLEPDHRCRADLSVVVGEARRARGIVLNLLDFARPVQPQRLPTDLNESLQQTLALVSTRLKRDGIQVERDLDPALDPILLDASQMKQVFLNLITNASQAMPDGGTLTVRTWREGDRVFVSIGDTGSGIDPETRARIFEPFFTTKPRGTGLGLSVSLGLVHNHGGQIELESRQGEGSTFTVCLPLEPPEVEPPAGKVGFEMIGGRPEEDAWTGAELTQRMEG